MEIKRFADYKKYLEIDMNKVINHVVKIKAVQKTIIDYIQKEQLQEGIDGNNKIIITDLAREQRYGYVYAKNTIYGTAKYYGKIEKGQEWKKVTLSDTLEFYSTFNVKVRPTEFEVIADMNKDEGSILDNFQDYPYEFLKLTKNSLQNFSDWLLSTHIKDYLKRLLTR